MEYKTEPSGPGHYWSLSLGGFVAIHWVFIGRHETLCINVVTPRGEDTIYPVSKFKSTLWAGPIPEPEKPKGRKGCDECWRYFKHESTECAVCGSVF